MDNLPEFITITDKGIIVPQVKQEIKLVPSNDPILTTKLEPFDFQSNGYLAVSIANDLIEAMQKYGGIGLAANQIGYYHRIFVAGKDENIVSYFNPEITNYSDDQLVMEEGCLSFPNLFLKIKRPARISIRYQDFNGDFKEGHFHGLTARTILHELDHINGIVFTSRVGSLSLKMAKDKQKKLQLKVERSKK
jgi:peptide deformylase